MVNGHFGHGRFGPDHAFLHGCFGHGTFWLSIKDATCFIHNTSYVGVTSTEVIANITHQFWNRFFPINSILAEMMLLSLEFVIYFLHPLTGWIPCWSWIITHSTCKYSINFQTYGLPCPSSLANLLFQPSQTLFVCGWMSKVTWSMFHLYCIKYHVK